MQKLLLTILVLIAVEGYQHLAEGTDSQGPEQSEPIPLRPHGGRTKRHYFHPIHREPARHRENNVLDVNVQNANWVCRNPKTGDMMIIMSDDVVPSFPNNWPQFQPQYPGNGHHWQSVLPNNNPHRWNNAYPNNGQGWPNQQNQPNGPPRGEGGQNNCSPNQGQIGPNAEVPVNTKTTTESSVPSSTSDPRTHGGEGLIDIRIAAV